MSHFSNRISLLSMCGLCLNHHRQWLPLFGLINIFSSWKITTPGGKNLLQSDYLPVFSSICTTQSPHPANLFLSPSSFRSMAKTCPRPPMTRRWRPSAPPRSPSWSRFCAELRIPNWSARMVTPRSQTSAPRPTSPSSTSWPLQTCLPLHPPWRSWRSICFQRSKYHCTSWRTREEALIKWAQVLNQSWPSHTINLQAVNVSVDEKLLHQ